MTTGPEYGALIIGPPTMEEFVKYITDMELPTYKFAVARGASIKFYLRREHPFWLGDDATLLMTTKLYLKIAKWARDSHCGMTDSHHMRGAVIRIAINQPDTGSDSHPSQAYRYWM